LKVLKSLAFNLECDIQYEVEYYQNLKKFSQIYAKKLEYNHMAVREPKDIKKAFKKFFLYLWQMKQSLKEKEYERKKRLNDLNVYRLFGDQLGNGNLLNNNYGVNLNYDHKVARANEGLADVKLQVEQNKDAKEALYTLHQIKEYGDFMKSSKDKNANYNSLMDKHKAYYNEIHKNLAPDIINKYA